MISPEDLKLFEYADDPEQALKLLQEALPTEPQRTSPGFAHSRTRGSDRG